MAYKKCPCFSLKDFIFFGKKNRPNDSWGPNPFILFSGKVRLTGPLFVGVVAQRGQRGGVSLLRCPDLQRSVKVARFVLGFSVFKLGGVFLFVC